ncbi:hypothetical protein [Longispora fulva]|uniref:Uncharacterized protein n=1 Tax=Longispora fulva TaxID=619741 RepID=A0A8J7GLG0_9ACTN|nr:hypothetical protein [Longispora fulva]MBG6139102.1 hypothetical protein [Longispora fulva]
MTQPASATPPTCSGATCEGKLAANYGCGADAYGIAGYGVADSNFPDPENTPPKIHGELMYSPLCDAVWGEYVTINPNDNHQIVMFVSDQYGGPYRTVQEQVNGLGGWQTTMVRWTTNSIKYCAIHDGVDPDVNHDARYGGLNVCSRWR